MTDIVKNSVKEKWLYSGYRKAFDEKGKRSFGNDYSRNVVIFGIENSSSSHADNCKNNFSVLNKGDIFGINGSFGAPERKFSINFTKTNTKLCLSLHYNGDNSYLFVNGKYSFMFKANNGSVNSSTRFFLESISDGFGTTEFREVSLWGNVYDFLVHSNAVDKSDILDVHK